MGVEIDVDETVDQLGIAGKQSVQIAKALANDAKVLIFDEPTASFGQKEVEKLFEIIQKLRQKFVQPLICFIIGNVDFLHPTVPFF